MRMNLIKTCLTLTMMMATASMGYAFMPKDKPQEAQTAIPTAVIPATSVPTLEPATVPTAVPTAAKTKTKTAVKTTVPTASKTTSTTPSVSVTPAPTTAPTVAATAVATPPPVEQSEKKFDEKSPWLAGFLAVVPGLPIHGLGHYYASKPIEGTACLLLEGASIYMGYQAFTIINAYSSDNGLGDNPAINTGQINKAISLVIGGTLLFTTTWIYDIVGAPMACNVWNKEQRQALSMQLEPQTQGPVLVLNWSGHF